MTPTDDQTGNPPSPDTLERVVTEHRAWLESLGVSGVQADLRSARLRGGNLARVDLRRALLNKADLGGADLSGADLKEADLHDADLAVANLQGADLQNAQLHGARFRDADLRDADLRDVRGLDAGGLGGADTSGARLPDAVSKFEGLAGVQESSRSAQTQFTSILLVCVYAWLTVIATRDAQLLNNAAPPSARLPILGTDIPLVQFYVVAPLLLLGLHLYFLLNLQRVWEELAALPAVFPDGRTLDKKATPWVLNGVVGLHFKRLRTRLPALTLWQARASAAVVFWVVPLTLTLLWARYLRMHDALVTSAHVAMTATAAGAGVGLYRLAIATLRGSGPWPAKRPKGWARAAARASSALAFLGVASVMGAVSLASINGLNMPLIEKGISLGHVPPRPVDPRVWVPRALDAVGVRAFAAIDEIDLSTKPPGWSGKEVELVKGADLGGRDLRYADAYAAFLVNAFLKESDLRGADLRDADLRGANLKGADLRGANLRNARLVKADLTGAILDRAVLRGADLTGADLTGARLRSANLQRANLSGADLSKADLEGADLRDAQLQGAALVAVKMRGADLTGATLRAPETADPLRDLGVKPARSLPAPAVMAPHLIGPATRPPGP